MITQCDMSALIDSAYYSDIDKHTGLGWELTEQKDCCERVAGQVDAEVKRTVEQAELTTFSIFEVNRSYQTVWF